MSIISIILSTISIILSTWSSFLYLRCVPCLPGRFLWIMSIIAIIISIILPTWSSFLYLRFLWLLRQPALKGINSKFIFHISEKMKRLDLNLLEHFFILFIWLISILTLRRWMTVNSFCPVKVFVKYIHIHILEQWRFCIFFWWSCQLLPSDLLVSCRQGWVCFQHVGLCSL